MKFCRFATDRFGVVEPDGVRDITDLVRSMIATDRPAAGIDPFIACLPAIRVAVERPSNAPVLAIESIELLAPVAAPGKIVGAPVNYQDHIDEMIGDPAATPHKHRDIAMAGLFLMAGSSLAGPTDTLKLRFLDRRTDPEVELVAVIGRVGRDIPYASALEHVAGYALGLDVTVRGPEDRSFRKSLDGYTVLGPWFVTADEIEDPSAIDLSLSVNGERRQHASTSNLIYDVARLIEYASSFYTLHPGDLIYSGTPAGVGPIFPGDVIDASATGLGAMRIEVAS